MKQLFVLINLMLIATGVYAAVDLFYRAAVLQLPPPPASAGVRQTAQPASAPPRQTFDHYRLILDRNLFDTAANAKPTRRQEAIDLEALQKTDLKLKLWGTVAGAGTRQAYAVIEDVSVREQQLYRVGDAIQKATVKMILREKVVLEVDGKDEVLAIEDVKSGHVATARRPGSRSIGRSSVRGQRIALKRSMIEESIRDISKLMTQVTIRPHILNGQPDGLALNNIKPNSIFRRMGLRNGDVLLGVDGQQIQTVDDALKLYDNLKNANSVRVDLRRRGREKTINYSIR